MNLWIRSQDKEKLISCNDIAIVTDSEDEKTIRGYKIVGYFDKNTEYEELGTYQTKERVLEVLNEVQTFIENNYVSLDDLPDHNYNTYPGYYPSIFTTMTRKKVFQMPKE